uniref:Ig-like domain-containing protein n=1 Tax=Sinocyclocheilus rhinocerous TaxID=307959 RepID=A0A673I4V8_9TELE
MLKYTQNCSEGGDSHTVCSDTVQSDSSSWSLHIVVLHYITGCDSLDSVEQNTTVQTAVEGAAVTISCQYETTDISPDLFWYQQKVNGFPEYMLNRFGTNDKHFKERFNGDLNTISKSFPLTIQDVRVSDSAVYYCALHLCQPKSHLITINNKLPQMLKIALPNATNIIYSYIFIKSSKNYFI